MKAIAYTITLPVFTLVSGRKIIFITPGWDTST